eukprot:s5_g28.t1
MVDLSLTWWMTPKIIHHCMANQPPRILVLSALLTIPFVEFLERIGSAEGILDDLSEIMLKDANIYKTLPRLLMSRHTAARDG